MEIISCRVPSHREFLAQGRRRGFGTPDRPFAFQSLGGAPHSRKSHRCRHEHARRYGRSPGNPPLAPQVKSAQSGLANNGLTNNPKFTWTSGGGGNGKFRVRLNGETAYQTHPQPGGTQTGWTLPSNAADGVWAIHVSEQDDLGRWGAEGDFTLRLDRTPPQFGDVKILGRSFPLRDGFITNLSALTLSYTVDGASRQLPCNLTDNASTACTAVHTDSVGNSSTFRRNIWRRSKVVFFHPDSVGDGSSWEQATNDLQAQIDRPDVRDKDFWLASGDYSVKNSGLDIFQKSAVTLLGGFRFNAYPTDTQNRDKGSSIIGGFSSMGCNSATFDGIQFMQAAILGSMGTPSAPAQFLDCKFNGRVEATLGSVAHFKNCQLKDVNSPLALATEVGSVITWEGGLIANNVPTSEYSIYIEEGSSATFNGLLTMTGNKGPGQGFQIRTFGKLEVATSVVFNCSDILWEATASGSCGGNKKP